MTDEQDERRMQHITAPNLGRIESGALQINDDYPGLFVRGDDAACLAHAIECALRFLPNDGFSYLLQFRELEHCHRLITRDVLSDSGQEAINHD